MKVIILSDIHGNYSAMMEVVPYVEQADAVVLLGDVIDYCPHSNEIIELLCRMKTPVVANIRGNHEQAVLKEEYARFSSDRGRVSARYTRSILNETSWEYINQEMTPGGKQEFEIDGRKCLALHGCLEDVYWKALNPEGNLELYGDYDYVFSGHSHMPHYFARYYRCENEATRNKKKTVFLNPGSVGQPRNLCPRAQFALWDTDTDSVVMKKIAYDIKKEQEAFSDFVDEFYKKRLENGI